ncbi:penicillin-binding protein activator [Spiribacter insolitus]|uniref:Penicillin-binding protein activator n=1 Tax=Spiribacter insolitus TaxID=3122417 RepID=A0ABV3T429_9GAMM
MFSARIAIALLTIALLIAGCAPMTPQDATPLDEIRSPQLDDAEEALALGNTSRAITLLRAAAEQLPKPEATGLQLEAATLALELDDSAPAERWLGTREANATPSNRAVATLLRTRLNPELPPTEVVDRLGTLPAALSARMEPLRLQSLARAEGARGDLAAAIDYRVSLADLTLSREQRLNNESALWAILMEATIPAVRESLSGQPNEAVEGWLQLAIGVRNRALQPAETETFIADWRDAQGSIEISDSFVDGVLAEQRADLSPPPVVAVLLPLTGELAAAGSAIQEGLLAAYYAEADRDDRPRLLFFDVGAAGRDVTAAYDAAVAAGADQVIGPLSKSGVRELVSAESLPVPVLALNRVPSRPGNDNVVQFGLAPENDARAVAAMASAMGHHRLLVMARDDEWGSRVSAAFRSAFQEAGGEILGQRRYPPDQDDLTGPIQSLFQLDLSDERYQRLRSITGEGFGFEARRRQDADGVFMAAFGRDARLITPQIRFHRGIDLPVFAISESYPQQQQAGADNDLSGVMLARMPWLLDEAPNDAGAGARQQLREANPERDPGQLVALGVDSYRLLRGLDALAGSTELYLPGATGRLSLNAEGLIQRQLIPARITSAGLERVQPARENGSGLPAYLP